MSLPNPGMNFTPFDPLPASEVNDMVENIEALAAGTGLDNGAVSTSKLSAPWTSWVPTITGLSGGTLNYAEYIDIGDIVWFRFSYTLASAPTGSVTFTLPYTATAATADMTLGTAHLVDTGTASFIGLVRQTNETTANICAINSGGSYAGTSAISSTVPHNWASTDIIQCQGMFRKA